MSLLSAPERHGAQPCSRRSSTSSSPTDDFNDGSSMSSPSRTVTVRPGHRLRRAERRHRRHLRRARRGRSTSIRSPPCCTTTRADRPGGRGRVCRARSRYDRIAIAYADCGTYGALDEVCARHGLARLGGAHCYDVYAGGRRSIARLSDDSPDLLPHRLPGGGFDGWSGASSGWTGIRSCATTTSGTTRGSVWLSGRRTPDLAAASGRPAPRPAPRRCCRYPRGRAGRRPLPPPPAPFSLSVQSWPCAVEQAPTTARSTGRKLMYR